MKAIVLFLLALTVSSCTSSTRYGKCIGLSDAEDPNLKYKVSTWNVVLAVVFVETVIVPVVIVLNEVYCPVSEKGK